MKNTNKNVYIDSNFLQSCATIVSWGFCQQNQKNSSNFIIKTITENVYVDHKLWFTMFAIMHNT